MSLQYSDKIKEIDFKMKYLAGLLGERYFYFLGTMVCEDGFTVNEAIKVMWLTFGNDEVLKQRNKD